MKIDWSEESEEGISTADFNRIEKTTEGIENLLSGDDIVVSGWRPNIPDTNRLEQPFFISVPAGYRLILEYVDYTGYGGGVALSIADIVSTNYQMDDDSIFNSFKDDGHKVSNHAVLDLVLLSNTGTTSVDYEIGIYDVFAQSGGNTTARGWTLRFVREIVPA